MCICNIFSILGLFIGELLYAVQKVIQCLAIGSVFTCLMFSFTVILMLGIGLGYNHCFVEGKNNKLTRSKPNWWRRSGVNDSDAEETDNGTSTDEMSVRRSWNKSMMMTVMTDARFNATTEDYTLSPTMVIPLDSKNNILKLIRRIRRQGKNVTLEIISK